jgi:hypothetical protein
LRVRERSGAANPRGRSSTSPFEIFEETLRETDHKTAPARIPQFERQPAPLLPLRKASAGLKGISFESFLFRPAGRFQLLFGFR